jgi:RecJ-like exonuclease
MTKKNLEISKSQYVGTIGEKYTGELEVYQMVQKTGWDGEPYMAFKLKDTNDNKFLAASLEKHFPNIKVGDKVKIKGRVKDHKEFVGVKFTALNYVKPTQ